MAAIEKPICVAMVLCDWIHDDPSTHKKFIMGTFSAIAAKTFPYTVPTFCVYAALTNGNGEMLVRIVIEEIDGNTPPVFEGATKVKFPGPLFTLDIGFNARSLVIPSAGKYVVRLLVDGEPCQERIFGVRLPPT